MVPNSLSKNRGPHHAWRGFFGAISAAEALLSGLAEFAGDARLHKADELAARRRRGVGLGTEQVLAEMISLISSLFVSVSSVAVLRRE